MCQMNKIVFLLCFISPALSWSHQPEEGKIFGTFGPHIYQSHLMQTEASVDNPIEKGFGLIAEGDLDHNGGLEIGMFYLNKQYVRQRSDQLLIERAKRMYITMG